MATATLGQVRVPARSETPAELHVEADHGPWLFLAAPVSFAITLAMVIWMSLTSL